MVAALIVASTSRGPYMNKHNKANTMLLHTEDLQVTERQDILLQAEGVLKEVITFLHILHHRYNPSPSPHCFPASERKPRYQLSLLRQRR